MTSKSRAKWITLLLAVAMLPASATFHFMKVVEIFPGTVAAPNAHYVVIQMYASGQQFVGGNAITIFNGAGTLIATHTFQGDVANGANQSKILIATPEAQTFFGLAADLVLSPSLLVAGGKVCFAGTIDCVAWGAYTGSAAGVGTPFNANGGLKLGQAAIRRLDIAGSAGVLDGADDTDNCANDFIFGMPAPQNNAGVPGTIPGATCGNGAIEGLEECDDGNLADGDACSSACKVTAVVVTPRSSSDFNGDGKSDVFWRHTSDGRNAIWLSGNSATQPVVATVTEQSWQVVGVGDFDGDGKSDVFWRNSSDGRNAIWLSGNSATQPAVASVTELAWIVVPYEGQELPYWDY